MPTWKTVSTAAVFALICGVLVLSTTLWLLGETVPDWLGVAFIGVCLAIAVGHVVRSKRPAK